MTPHNGLGRSFSTESERPLKCRKERGIVTRKSWKKANRSRRSSGEKDPVLSKAGQSLTFAKSFG